MIYYTVHANNIVYRDLKLENILLDEDGYIRLSDFGLSARARRWERIHSFSGTATYLAPEIILDNGEDGHTHCVDLWCFGVMLFIMLTQEPPFWSEHYPDLFHLIKTSEVPYEDYDHLSKDAISVLKGVCCLMIKINFKEIIIILIIIFIYLFSFLKKILKRD